MELPRPRRNALIGRAGEGVTGIVPLPPLAGFVLAVLLLGLIPGGRLAAGQFQAGVNLVEVFATVTDERSGRPVTGLQAADFTVLEDGVPQRIATFTAGDLPLAVAIAVDRSFSMKEAGVARQVRAVRTFVGAMKPTDEVMVLAIGGEAEIVAPLSTDRQAALAALDRLTPWGTTPLYDAVLQAMTAVQQGRGRRVLVLLSDGQNRYSSTTAAALVTHGRGMDVQVYPIALGRTIPPLFAELASVTGGRSMLARDDTQLQQELAALSADLRSQYLIGYTPEALKQPGSVRWRSIGVTVNRPDMRIRARDGYFAR